MRWIAIIAVAFVVFAALSAPRTGIAANPCNPQIQKCG